MIDLHCHLDLYPAPHEIVRECVRRGTYVLSVTTVPSAFEGTVALVESEGRIRTALGLHPELAAARAHELSRFEALLPRTRYVGEVGLDGSKDHRGTLERQRGVLADVLGLCARAGGRVLTLHSRGATSTVLDSLAARADAGTFVLHWYLGSARQIARASEMGCWFSVGPSMLTSRRGMEAAAAMPRDRVLPESDGPFGLIDRRAAYPWEAWSVVPLLAALWREPEGEVEGRLKTAFRVLGAAANTLEPVERSRPRDPE